MTLFPNELFFNVSQFLYPEEIARASATGKQWCSLFNQPLIWKEKIKKHFPSEFQKIPSSPHDSRVHYRKQFDECMLNLISKMDGDQETLYYLMALGEQDWFQLGWMDIACDKLIDTDYGDCNPLDIIATAANAEFKTRLYKNISQGFRIRSTGRIDTHRRDAYGLTILYWAIVLDQNFEKVILPLVSQGSSFQEKWLFPGFGPAQIAVLYDNVNLLNQLLKQDPAMFFQKTIFGRVPMRTAVAAGSVNALRALFDFAGRQDIDADALLFEEDILQVAILSKSVEMVRMISQRYPTLINHPDTLGMPPLYKAASLQLVKIGEWLLSAGADSGQSCELADRLGKSETARLIRQLCAHRKRRFQGSHLFKPVKKARQEETRNDAKCDIQGPDRPRC